MAGPEYIQLPEMNLGPLPRRRRRPRPAPVVAGIDEPEAAPALTTELRERDTAPEPQNDALSGIGSAADRLRQQLGLTPPPSAPSVVAGIDDEEESQAAIDAGLSGLREQRGPLAVQRAQSIPLPGAEDSPESTRAILGAIEQERTALPGIPRTQLQQPRVAPPAARSIAGARYGAPVVAGIDDDIEAEPMEEDAQGLGRPQTGMSVVEGVDDFDEEFAPAAQPKARQIPGVQAPDPHRDDAADARDRQRMRRMNGIQGAISGALGLGGIIAAARDTNVNAPQYDMSRIMGTSGGLMSEGPRANIAARGERRQYEDAQFAAQEQARAEQEDLAFRRENEARRAQLDERRIGQAEAATAEHARRTSAEFDVDSTDANGLREVYDATINSLPEEAQRALAGWVDLDTTGYNARSMAAVIDQLNDAVKVAQQTNPRAFRQGQRAGGRRRAGGRLGGIGGGGRGANYGYGVQSREGGAPIESGPIYYDPAQGEPPTIVGPDGRPRETVARPSGQSQGSAPSRPRQAAPMQPAAPSAPAPGRVLWDRPPTEAESDADPTLDYKEALIERYAQDNGLDLNDRRQRRRAAGFVDSMRENTEDAMGARMGQERTPEQQRQVERYVHDYGPVHGREVQLQNLGGSIHRVLQQPNGALIVRAALHADSGLPAAIAANEREVTALRAQIYDHLNEYFHTYGGANVTDNELMRYFSAFGAGAINADPREFLEAVRRSRRREQSRLNQGDIAFPDGSRIYFESQERQR